ncbi:NAD-dependent epimerase/dehydratase family protein [Pelagibacteraceae bacterium]|nr:NAD-dependent epimerase/dehydratase family protein [Pelagibacteraceae bacterium]
MILITGAGGFIGGHLCKHFIDKNIRVRAVDVKPLNEWYQVHSQCENKILDLKSYDNCFISLEGVDHVYNLACDMGGMGFIENNKALCMFSVLINTNLLLSIKNYNLLNQSRKINRYFYSSSACVYNATKQTKSNVTALKEEDAYPALPEDGYGWEKLFSERMCQNYMEDFGLECRVARFHNVYGPLGTYDGGREKAPAAICRKIIEAENTGNKEIEVWGDGLQTRSFMYIDDCITGILKIMESDVRVPINLGSDELVSINQLIDYTSEIADYHVNKKYIIDAPKGVRGRNSDNEFILKQLSWKPSINLREGLKITYEWIKSQMDGRSEQRVAFIRGGNAG